MPNLMAPSNDTDIFPFKANMALVDIAKTIAERRGATPAQVARSRLLVQKPWILPIPGTTRLHRIEENLGAVKLKLTAADLAEIAAGLAEVEVQGERLPETALKMTGFQEAGYERLPMDSERNHDTEGRAQGALLLGMTAGRAKTGKPAQAEPPGLGNILPRRGNISCMRGIQNPFHEYSKPPSNREARG
jgi:hypothetical protein